MEYSQLVDYLFSLKDDKLASFNKKLSNSDYLFIGIKIPVLRKIIKDIKKDSSLSLIDFNLGKYFEIDFIYYALSLIRNKDINNQLLFLKKEIRNGKSWMITDCIPTFISKFNFSTYYSFFLEMYNSKYTYDRRLIYVLGLKLSKEKEILNLLPYIKENDEYIVDMAKAWLLATIAINYPEEIFKYVSNLSSSLLKRKTISKIIESYRIDNNIKNKFKTLRD